MSLVTYRKLVMPGDLNPANTLFGGKMMAWIDEAAALYAMCQMESRNIVTKKITEIDFQQPVHSGDFLEFNASIVKIGRTSLTIGINVTKKLRNSRVEVCSCSIVFVNLDSKGAPYPHGMLEIKELDNDRVSS